MGRGAGAEGDAIRFALPTVVAPRYVPNEAGRGVSPTPGERVSPPVESRCRTGSRSRPRSAAGRGRRGRVADAPDPDPLADGKARVEWRRRPGDGPRPRAAAHPGGGGEALRAPGAPGRRLGRGGGELRAAISRSGGPREVEFLVDRSGSMNGDSIEAARGALEPRPRSLEEGDAFDVVGFVGFETLFGAPRPTRRRAWRKPGARGAPGRPTSGGRRSCPRCRRWSGPPPPASAARWCCPPTARSRTTTRWRRSPASTRRRRGCSRSGSGTRRRTPRRAVARASGGAAEMILPGRALEATVVRQFGRLRAAALEDVRVAWSGAKAQLQAPATVAQLFDGEPLAVYAAARRRACRGALSPATLARGRRCRGRWSWIRRRSRTARCSGRST